MLLGASKTLTFLRFKLVLRPHPNDRHRVFMSLLHDENPVHAERQQLELLRLFIEDYPGEILTKDQIAAALWPNSTNGINLVERQMNYLRAVLGDDHRRPLFIQTLNDSAGYKFIAPVRVEGDLGRLDGFLKWSTHLFLKKLEELRRNDEDDEDLRIVTTGLVPSRQDADYEDYLKRGVRIRIVMMNPEAKDVLATRYGLRTDDVTTDVAQGDIRKQITYLRGLISKHGPESLQIRLSNASPSGLIVHSRHWALLGIFPAQGSYILGPMVITAEGDSLWHNLYNDWDCRWKNPAAIVSPDPAGDVFSGKPLPPA